MNDETGDSNRLYMSPMMHTGGAAAAEPAALVATTTANITAFSAAAVFGAGGLRTSGQANTAAIAANSAAAAATAGDAQAAAHDAATCVAAVSNLNKLMTSESLLVCLVCTASTAGKWPCTLQPLLAGKPRQHQYTCICFVQQIWRSSPTQIHVWWIDDLTDHSTATQAKNVAETATALTGLLGAVAGFMAADASAAASGGVLSFAPAAPPSTVGRHFACWQTCVTH